MSALTPFLDFEFHSSIFGLGACFGFCDRSDGEETFNIQLALGPFLFVAGVLLGKKDGD